MIKYSYAHKLSWSKTAPNLLVIGEYAPKSYTSCSRKTQVLKFAREHKFGSVTFCNLYAAMVDHTAGLRIYADRIGPRNNHEILKAAYNADTIICAWGDSKLGDYRAVQVLNLLTPFKLHHIGKTENKRGLIKFTPTTHEKTKIQELKDNPYSGPNLTMKVLEVLETYGESTVDFIYSKIPEMATYSVHIICQELVRREKIYMVNQDVYSISHVITKFTKAKINLLKSLRQQTTGNALDLLNGVINDLKP